MKSTCMVCEERVIGCHVTCNNYAEFRRKRDEIKENRRLASEDNIFHTERFFARKK